MFAAILLEANLVPGPARRMLCPFSRLAVKKELTAFLPGGVHRMAAKNTGEQRCEAPHFGFRKPAGVCASTLHVSSSRLDDEAAYSYRGPCRLDENNHCLIPAFRRNFI